MSTDFDIRCCTCSSASKPNECGLNEQRSPRELFALIAVAKEAGAVGRVFAQSWFYLRDWDVFQAAAPGLFRFFAEHGDHRLAVFDEYGHEWVMVQTYDGDGQKVGGPEPHRLHDPLPRFSATITMP